eukprot:5492581-Amphidinium_carterae.2
MLAHCKGTTVYHYEPEESSRGLGEAGGSPLAPTQAGGATFQSPMFSKFGSHRPPRRVPWSNYTCGIDVKRAHLPRPDTQVRHARLYGMSNTENQEVRPMA